MARKENALKLGFGYNISAAAPIDSRMLVEKVSDLTDPTQWLKHPKLPCTTFKGMIVAVEDTSEVYVLADEDHTILENWKKIGSDASGVIEEVLGDEKKFEDVDGILTVSLNSNDFSSDTWEKVLDENEVETNCWKVSGINDGSYLTSAEIQIPSEDDLELGENDEVEISGNLFEVELPENCELQIWKYVPSAEMYEIPEKWDNVVEEGIELGSIIKLRFCYRSDIEENAWSIDMNEPLTISISKKEIKEEI